MKKLMLVIGLGLLSESLWAAGMGPFQYDDRGAYVGSASLIDGNGVGIPSVSSTTLSTAVPRVVGQLVYCNSCTTFNNGAAGLCMSTSTANAGGNYIAISSATAVSACK